MPSIDAPFGTEEALIEGLVERFLAEDPNRLRHKVAYYRHALLKVFKSDGQPVFTHADLQLKNIMLQPDGRVAILDWAESGWYPMFWECAVALCAYRGWSNDWHTHIGLFLEEFPNHFVWMSRLQMDRWYKRCVTVPRSRPHPRAAYPVLVRLFAILASPAKKILTWGEYKQLKKPNTASASHSSHRSKQLYNATILALDCN